MGDIERKRKMDRREGRREGKIEDKRKKRYRGDMVEDRKDGRKKGCKRRWMDGWADERMEMEGRAEEKWNVSTEGVRNIGRMEHSVVYDIK